MHVVHIPPLMSEYIDLIPICLSDDGSNIDPANTSTPQIVVPPETVIDLPASKPLRWSNIRSVRVSELDNPATLVKPVVGLQCYPA